MAVAHVQPGWAEGARLVLCPSLPGHAPARPRSRPRSHPQGDVKGEGGLDDATGTNKFGGGASMRQTSSVVDLTKIKEQDDEEKVGWRGGPGGRPSGGLPMLARGAAGAPACAPLGGRTCARPAPLPPPSQGLWGMGNFKLPDWITGKKDKK